MAQPSPQIQPYLLYEDVAAAIDWLTEAFGFEERLRYEDEEGTASHAELRLPGGGVVFLGDPGDDYRSPKSLGGTRTSQVHVYVDDVDSHYEQARAAGAEIRQELAETPYGDRRYDAYDPEGQLWSFAQRIKDVAPAEWGAKPAA